MRLGAILARMKKVILILFFSLAPLAVTSQVPVGGGGIAMQGTRDDAKQEEVLFPAEAANKLGMEGAFGKHTYIKAVPVVSESYDNRAKRLGIALEVSGIDVFFSYAALEIGIDGVSQMIPTMPWKAKGGLRYSHAWVTIWDEALVRRIGNSKAVRITVISDTDIGMSLHLSGDMSPAQVLIVRDVVKKFDSLEIEGMGGKNGI